MNQHFAKGLNVVAAAVLLREVTHRDFRQVDLDGLEGPFKRSEAPRNPGHPKLVGAQRSAARGRTITGKAEGKIGRQLSAVSRTDQTAHLFSAAQILDLRAALRKSVVAV